MLPSKVLAAGNGGDPSSSASAGSSSSSQVAETTIPNFLLKLWKLVEDERYNHCISWDATGFSFHVRDPYGFSKDVLPLYFKHSNLNSFIRQLNMYGFRKVTNLEKGALKQQLDQDTLEFQHPYFVRGHPELLDYIKRKISNPRPGGELDIHQHNGGVRGINHVLEEVRQLREKQLSMDAKLSQMKKENSAVWREVAHMRQLHMKQQQVVNKLIQFLLSLVQPATGKRLGKRQLLAIGPSLFAERQGDPGEQPAKRLRSDSATSTSSAVQMIESLEQELQNSGRRAFLAPATGRTRDTSGGPIIADVTDELDSYDMKEPVQQPDLGPGTVMDGGTAMAMSSAGGIVPASGGIVPVPGSTSEGYGYGDTTVVPSTRSAGGVIDQSLLQTPSSDHVMPNLPFDVLSPDSDSFLNVTGPDFQSAASVSGKTVSPQSIRTQEYPAVAPRPQTGNQPPARPSLSRSISANDGAGAVGLYTNPDWNRTNQSGGGDQGKWSKPEFSEYVDFVQTDLDSLRDFLASGAFTVDQDSLSSLFTMADETSTMAEDSPLSGPSEITGNEVQLYKPREFLFNIDGSPAVVDGTSGVEPNPLTADPSAGVGTRTIAVQPPTMTATAPLANQPRPGSQLPKPLVTGTGSRNHISQVSGIRQQQHSRRFGTGAGPTSLRTNQPTDQSRMTAGQAAGITATGSIVVPGPGVVVSQPVYVLSSTGGLQRGIVVGPPATQSSLQQQAPVPAQAGVGGKNRIGR